MEFFGWRQFRNRRQPFTSFTCSVARELLVSSTPQVGLDA
jgi:hypothetical protein